MIDERGRGAPGLTRLGEMLDALVERRQALLEGRPCRRRSKADEPEPV